MGGWGSSTRDYLDGLGGVVEGDGVTWGGLGWVCHRVPFLLVVTYSSLSPDPFHLRRVAGESDTGPPVERQGS